MLKTRAGCPPTPTAIASHRDCHCRQLSHPGPTAIFRRLAGGAPAAGLTALAPASSAGLACHGWSSLYGW